VIDGCSLSASSSIALVSITRLFRFVLITDSGTLVLYFELVDAEDSERNDESSTS